MSSAVTEHKAAVTLRQALGAYPTGVTVVTAFTAEGRAVGLTVNSFASLSLEPPLLLWSLANKSPNLRTFRTASHFAINILERGQSELALRFATPSIVDKFEGVAWDSEQEAPLLTGCAAHFVCATRDVLEAGDHSLFIGRVVGFDRASTAEALVFYSGKFAAVAASA